MKKRFKLSTMLITAALSIVAATTVFPFYIMIVSALKTNNEYAKNFLGLPRHVTFKSFSMLFDRFNVLGMAFNSLLVTVVSLIASTFIIALAGFIFAKLPYRGSNKILMSIVACMTIPTIILLIPIYQMMSSLNLINNYFSLIIYYTAEVIPFSLYLLTSNFRDAIPTECIESAKIDGAGLFSLFRHIALPLGKPAIFTLLTLNFLYIWNEFLYSMLFLQTNELRTLTVGVATIIGKRVTDMPFLYAGLLVNTIPVVIVFGICQKYLVKGLTAGAVKG